MKTIDGIHAITINESGFTIVPLAQEAKLRVRVATAGSAGMGVLLTLGKQEFYVWIDKDGRQARFTRKEENKPGDYETIMSELGEGNGKI